MECRSWGCRHSGTQLVVLRAERLSFRLPWLQDHTALQVCRVGRRCGRLLVYGGQVLPLWLGSCQACCMAVVTCTGAGAGAVTCYLTAADISCPGCSKPESTSEIPASTTAGHDHLAACLPAPRHPLLAANGGRRLVQLPHTMQACIFLQPWTVNGQLLTCHSPGRSSPDLHSDCRAWPRAAACLRQSPLHTSRLPDPAKVSPPSCR